MREMCALIREALGLSQRGNGRAAWSAQDSPLYLAVWTWQGGPVHGVLLAYARLCECRDGSDRGRWSIYHCRFVTSL